MIDFFYQNISLLIKYIDSKVVLNRENSYILSDLITVECFDQYGFGLIEKII